MEFKDAKETKDAFHPLEKGVYSPLVSLGAFLSIAALVSFIVFNNTIHKFEF